VVRFLAGEVRGTARLDGALGGGEMLRGGPVTSGARCRARQGFELGDLAVVSPMDVNTTFSADEKESGGVRRSTLRAHTSGLPERSGAPTPRGVGIMARESTTATTTGEIVLIRARRKPRLPSRG
jgi:hypothetical protein